MSSDDLVEVVEGRLHVASGMAHGRVRVDARFRDVLELRRFL
jgi:putative sterol carrier protein